jgi:hypothetical protein
VNRAKFRGHIYPNLFKDINNKREAYALLKGLQLGKTLSNSQSECSRRLQDCYKDDGSVDIPKKLKPKTFFHILREHNKATNTLANEAIGKPSGTLGV